MKETLEQKKARLEAELASVKAEIKSAKQVKNVVTVSLEIRKKIVALIIQDSKRTDKRANGYKWPDYNAAKIFYAARAAQVEIDPTVMKDSTALTLAKAYGLI